MTTLREYIQQLVSGEQVGANDRLLVSILQHLIVECEKSPTPTATVTGLVDAMVRCFRFARDGCPPHGTVLGDHLADLLELFDNKSGQIDTDRGRVVAGIIYTIAENAARAAVQSHEAAQHDAPTVVN